MLRARAERDAFAFGILDCGSLLRERCWWTCGMLSVGKPSQCWTGVSMYSSPAGIVTGHISERHAISRRSDFPRFVHAISCCGSNIRSWVRCRRGTRIRKRSRTPALGKRQTGPRVTVFFAQAPTVSSMHACASLASSRSGGSPKVDTKRPDIHRFAFIDQLLHCTAAAAVIKLPYDRKATAASRCTFWYIIKSSHRHIPYLLKL